MSFQYYQNNEDFVQQEYARQQRESIDDKTSVPVYAIKKGITQVRILPAYGPHGRWFRELLQHYVRVNGKGQSFTCRAMTNEVCPICEHGRALRAKGDPESVQQAGEFKAKSAYLFNVIVLSDPSGAPVTPEVKVLLAREMVKKEIIALDRNPEWGNITSLEKGTNLTIERTGIGKTDTRYTVRPSREASNIVEILANKGIDIMTLSLHNLDEVYPPRSAEAMVEALSGTQTVKGFPGATPAAPVAVPAQPLAAPILVQPVPAPGTPVTAASPAPAPVAAPAVAMRMPVLPPPPPFKKD